MFTAVGAGGVYLVWNRDPALDPVRLLGPARPVLRARLPRRRASTTCAFVRPVRALARLVVRVDRRDRGRRRRGHRPRRRGGSAACCADRERQPADATSPVLLAGVVIIVLAVVVLT